MLLVQADLVESAVQALISAAGPVDLMSRPGEAHLQS